MAKKKINGAVSWYVPEKKKPIIHSNMDASYTIEVYVEKLAEMDVKCTPQALLNYFNESCIGLYEEKKILQACIDAGCGSYVMELAENGIILKRWMK